MNSLYFYIIFIFFLPIILFFFAPQILLSFFLSIINFYRDWQGRKKARIVFRVLDEWAKEKKIPHKEIQIFFNEHKSKIVKTEGNIAISEIFRNAHPIVKDDYPQDRLWIYELRKLITKYLE